MKTIIQTRIDADVRQNAEKVLNSMGFSLNDGIRIFLHQVINERALPFRPTAAEQPNEYLQKCMTEVEEKKNLVQFDSTDDFSKWLDS